VVVLGVVPVGVVGVVCAGVVGVVSVFAVVVGGGVVAVLVLAPVVPVAEASGSAHSARAREFRFSMPCSSRSCSPELIVLGSFSKSLSVL
jgi:hypothetical protein